MLTMLVITPPVFAGAADDAAELLPAELPDPDELEPDELQPAKASAAASTPAKPAVLIFLFMAPLLCPASDTGSCDLMRLSCRPIGHSGRCLRVKRVGLTRPTLATHPARENE
jgi:hypothetical protein